MVVVSVEFQIRRAVDELLKSLLDEGIRRVLVDSESVGAASSGLRRPNGLVVMTAKKGSLIWYPYGVELK